MTTRSPEYLVGQTDSLTGLPDRRALSATLKGLLPQVRLDNRRCGVLFVDLRRFNQINEQYGHDAADLLLCAAAERIKECVAPSGVVARHGGDQFIVVLPDIVDECEVGISALRITEEMERYFPVSGGTVRLGSRIGLACFPDDSEDADTLVHSANVALNDAKRTGGEGLRFFAQDMRDRVLRNRAMESELQSAIESKQFSLHFQPIYSFKTDLPYAAEALIRWQHPTKGMIRPDQFIPVAEATGQIIDMGRWVVAETCRQLARWQAMGISLVVSLNVSSHQLPDGLPVDWVAATLQQHRIDPAQLIFEITESVMISDTEETHNWVNAISAMGIRLSMDDFGTGYASLGFLKRYRMHNVKIDKSFVMAMMSDPGQYSVVKTILDFGRGLGLSVTAEGIEDLATLDMLRELGCNYAQGFHLSRPVPPEQLETLLADLARKSQTICKADASEQPMAA